MRLFWIAAGILVLDQVTKVIVRLNMNQGYLGAIDLVGDWLKFTYTENPGMAFGINFGPPGLITGFSIVAAVMIGIYLFRIRGGYMPYTASLACILGGATGNIVDRLFYGMIFGYGPFFQGRGGRLHSFRYLVRTSPCFHSIDRGQLLFVFPHLQCCRYRNCGRCSGNSFVSEKISSQAAPGTVCRNP